MAHHLGDRVKILWMAGPAAILALLWILSFVGFTVSAESLPAEPVVFFAALFGVTLLAVAGYFTYVNFEYNHYMYNLTEDELTIEHGIINKHVTVIPYRKIQGVRIERTIIERLHTERPDDTVVIIADRESETGVLTQVMDQVKLGGIAEVSIAAAPRT